jgi:putative transposase
MTIIGEECALDQSKKHRGRPRTIDLREVLNAIFYINRSGCSWRMLPHDFPNWAAVFRLFQDMEKNRALEAY